MTDEQFQSLKFLEESTIQDAEAAKKFGIAPTFNKQSFLPEQSFLISNIENYCKIP